MEAALDEMRQDNYRRLADTGPASVDEDGGLLLESPSGAFGQDGAYVVVRDRRDHAVRVPLHESFHVYVDRSGVLRADHDLCLWRVRAVRLHYKLEPAS